MEELFRAYWWPLYAYLRRLGIEPDESADVVQGLFADLLARERLSHADPTRGKFRSWLLSALQFHLSHERERARAVKRGGGARIVPLEEAEAERRWIGLAHREQEPERVFERAWALEVLKGAMHSLADAYSRDRKAELFEALKPHLVGELGKEDLRTLATRLGMTTAALKSASFRMRRALGQAIRAELAGTLGEQCDVDAELRALFSALSAPGTGKP